MTSRQGVRLRLFSSFVILNLNALSEEQQGRAINMQLSDSTFYAHLRDFSKIRSTLDEIYTTQAFPLPADRDVLERAEHPDLFALPSGGGFDPGKRARSLDDDGRFVGRRDGQPRSAILRALTALLTPRFGAIDRVLASMGTQGIGSTDYAEQLRARLLAAWEAEGRMDGKELRLCTKLGLLVQKRRAPQQLARDGSSGAHGTQAGAHGAEELWREIVARTDELYEVSEAMQPAFLHVCKRVFHDVGQAIDERYGKYAAFTDGGLKDPVRLHEKAVDDYATRFADGVLPEACVTTWGNRCTFTEAKRFFLDDGAPPRLPPRRGRAYLPDGACARQEQVPRA